MKRYSGHDLARDTYQGFDLQPPVKRIRRALSLPRMRAESPVAPWYTRQARVSSLVGSAKRDD